MPNFRLNVYPVYLFWHRYSLHYNVLSGLIIISFSRSKRYINYMPMHYIGRKPVRMQNFKCSSTATVIELCFFMKKMMNKEKKMKNLWNHIYLYFIPHVTFSSNFLHAVTFLHVLHFDVLRRQIKIETESIFPYTTTHGIPYVHSTIVLCDNRFEYRQITHTPTYPLVPDY